MHHPEICLIMQVIEDYFLLTGSEDPIYQIEPITHRVDNCINSIGVRLKRKLVNGYVYIQIRGEKQDDNTATFSYSLSPNNDEYLESIRTDSSKYLDDDVRDIMRAIFIIDKDPSQHKPKCVPIAA
jgi:hypothetical protein